MIMIAGGVVGVTTAMFFGAYFINCVGQLRHGGTYDLPISLVSLFQLILPASITILGLGAVRAIKAPGRLAEREKTNGDKTIETSSDKDSR
jgi:hypothetical protein